MTEWAKSSDEDEKVCDCLYILLVNISQKYMYWTELNWRRKISILPFWRGRLAAGRGFPSSPTTRSASRPPAPGLVMADFSLRGFSHQHFADFTLCENILVLSLLLRHNFKCGEQLITEIVFKLQMQLLRTTRGSLSVSILEAVRTPVAQSAHMSHTHHIICIYICYIGIYI